MSDVNFSGSYGFLIGSPVYAATYVYLVDLFTFVLELVDSRRFMFLCLSVDKLWISFRN